MVKKIKVDTVHETLIEQIKSKPEKETIHDESIVLDILSKRNELYFNVDVFVEKHPFLDRHEKHIVKEYVEKLKKVDMVLVKELPEIPELLKEIDHE